MIKGLSKEKEIVIILSQLSLTNEEQLYCKETIQEPIDLSKILFYLLDNKTENIFFNNVMRYDLYRYIPRKIRKKLELLYAANALRNERLQKELSTILKLLYKKNIKPILLKGSFLNNFLYSVKSLRFQNDIDILVKESDLKEITLTLEENGYIQGFINTKLNIIDKATKTQKIFSRLYTHELIPFIRKNDDLLISNFIIDVQFDIFSQAKNNSINIDRAFLFDRSEKGYLLDSNIPFFHLSIPDNIIQMCSHLFQDMTMIESIEQGKDLELINFIDIKEYINKNKDEINWQEFSSYILNNKLEKILYYTLFHVNKVYENTVPISFMEEIKPMDIGYLNQFGFEEQEPLNWDSRFEDRLFNPNRKNVLENITNQDMFETKKYRKVMNGVSND